MNKDRFFVADCVDCCEDPDEVKTTINLLTEETKAILHERQKDQDPTATAMIMWGSSNVMEAIGAVKRFLQKEGITLDGYKGRLF